MVYLYNDIVEMHHCGRKHYRERERKRERELEIDNRVARASNTFYRVLEHVREWRTMPHYLSPMPVRPRPITADTPSTVTFQEKSAVPKLGPISASSATSTHVCGPHVMWESRLPCCGWPCQPPLDKQSQISYFTLKLGHRQIWRMKTVMMMMKNISISSSPSSSSSLLLLLLLLLLSSSTLSSSFLSSSSSSSLLLNVRSSSSGGFSSSSRCVVIVVVS